MSNVNPLRELGVFKLTIVNVMKKEASSFKGKSFPPNITITLEAEDGRLIDEKISLQYPGETEKEVMKRGFDKKRFEQLTAAASVEKASDLKGKTVAVLVEPFEWQGKVIWNPKKYYSCRFLANNTQEIDSSYDSTDSIPF